MRSKIKGAFFALIVCVNRRLFFKQWGGTNKKKRGRLLEGRLWDQMPEAF
jgi:protein gp37